MHRFARHAPFDTTTYVPPAESDRSGPPLSQGFLFTMVSTVAAEHCSEEALAVLARLDPDAWYHGQLLETLLNQMEDKDPALPALVGRNIYYMMRSHLEALGITSCRAVLEAVPTIWVTATRGDGGVWRSMVGPNRAHLEAEQPYNCMFEVGTLRGLLEAYGATNVRIAHGPCMRNGAPFCTMEVRWDDRPSYPGQSS